MKNRILCAAVAAVLSGCGSSSNGQKTPHCSDENKIDDSRVAKVFIINNCNDVNGYVEPEDDEHYEEITKNRDSVEYSLSSDALSVIPKLITIRGSSADSWIIGFDMNSQCFEETIVNGDVQDIRWWCDEDMYYHQIMSEFDYDTWSGELNQARKNATYIGSK